MAHLFGSCPQCNQLLPESISFSTGLEPCPHCGNGACLLVFPAAKAGRKKNNLPEALGESTDSSCLYHPENKASAICSSCGAFVCQLCEIHLQSEPICPACLDRQVKSGKNAILKKTHFVWDNISLGLSLLPFTFVFWFVSLFTAPCAVFLACRHWKDAGVLRRPSRFRMGLAVLLGLLQVGGWIMLVLFLFNAFSKLASSH